jgi:hypothetical protein
VTVASGRQVESSFTLRQPSNTGLRGTRFGFLATIALHETSLSAVNFFTEVYAY